jgi:hypothetical protein
MSLRILYTIYLNTLPEMVSMSVKQPEAKCCKSRSRNSNDHVISTEPLNYWSTLSEWYEFNFKGLQAYVNTINSSYNH